MYLLGNPWNEIHPEQRLENDYSLIMDWCSYWRNSSNW